jgi:hypothetical protein
VKTWREVDWENCDLCGDGVECFTDCEEKDEKGNIQFWDGDECRCVGCNEKGTMIADGERAYVDWNVFADTKGESK